MRALAAALLVAGILSFASTSQPQVTPAAAGQCATCHTEAARDWETSAHHRSASDPSYVEAVTREPLPFCRHCHEPSAAGIGCVDCHANVPPKHDASTKMPKARACAGCHEFRFPEGTTLMQKTEMEHAASKFATTACSTCHAGHRFDVASLLPQALVTEVRRDGTRILFHLQPGNVGHAFPTGDLFRRLVVSVEATDPSGNVVARAARSLQRHFIARGATKIETHDDRVGMELADFALDVGHNGSGLPLRVEIAFEAPKDGHPESAVHVPVFHTVL